jgi:hypothetical protein
MFTMSKPNVNRRRFLRYVGAGAIVAAGATAGYCLYRPGLGQKEEVTTATSTTVDYPPYPDFKYKPYYLNPTDQQTIQFTNTSYDLGGDPLQNTWLIDNKEVSHEHDYSTKLPVGEHLVDLQVSDGRQTRVKSGTITVESDQIYPVKPLRLKYKGISYFAGPVPPDWAGIPNPNEEEMDEQLGTIRNDLGCNAIIISGGEDYEDKLIECGQLAIENGFERIHIQPRYMGASPDETVERIGKFATRVRELRQASEAVVYSVGHEFALETAIIGGDNWFERLKNFLRQDRGDLDKIRATLPSMFRDILATCRENYGYKISYAAISYLETDIVPWENPAFESVGVDAILEEELGSTEDWVLNLFSHLKKYHKPIQCMEAGCMSFTGAGKVAGTAPLQTNSGIQELVYDEDEQANWIKRYCDLLNRARIDGYFYTQYNDPRFFDKGFGLYNGFKRKKGFYMYKSYRLTP